MHPIQQKILDLSKLRDLSKLSIREIGRQISTDPAKPVHPQLIKYHVKKMYEAGVIDNPGVTMGSYRSSATISDASNNTQTPNLISIPILGSANCGPATFFADNQVKGYLKISPSLLNSREYKGLFALQAEGDSMNNAKIRGSSIKTGDYVIVDSNRRIPKDGDYVVIVYDDKANVKKIFFDYNNERIALLSESTLDFEPIFIDPRDSWEGLISGTVIQVVQKPQK